MRSLIIGYGSIGKRHANLLSRLHCDVALVTSQQVDGLPHFSTIAEAFNQNQFDYIVISNPTHLHHATLKEIMTYDYKGTILVEKPLYAQMKFLPNPNNVTILTAYNLRFSELLTKTKEILQQEDIISFSAHVGQYLPDWRPGTDYKKSYSAIKNQGGGVLRDLSHELDYALWFCGKCIEVSAIGGQHSELEIDSDDVYSILMRCEACPIVTLQLNYLNRAPQRNISIQTKNHTITIDLIKGYIMIDGDIIHQVTENIESTYIKQHEAIMAGNHSQCCTYKHGMSIVQLIEAIEHANLSKTWVRL